MSKRKRENEFFFFFPAQHNTLRNSPQRKYTNTQHTTHSQHLNSMENVECLTFW